MCNNTLPAGYSIVPSRGGRGFAFKSNECEYPHDGVYYSSCEEALQGAIEH